MGSLVFLVQLNELNLIEGNPMTIKIPYLIDIEGYDAGFNVWLVLVGTLTVGVLVGFLLALFQIVGQKSEVYSLKSKLRRVQMELDSLRNQSIDDDIVLTDDVEDTLL